MIPYERQQMILDEIIIHNFLHIEDIIKLFPDISESTIRRDLKKLSEKNLIELLHGGGVKSVSSSYDVPINEKISLYKEEKEHIGKLAANEVKDNEVIYIDSGTTPFSMVKYITANNVTIVTTNLTVIKSDQNPKIKDIILVSGDVNFNLDSISGTLTDEALKSMYFDRAFIGATGFGITTGVTTPDIREATKKRVVRTNSSKTYILADYSKLNKKAFYNIFGLDSSLVITNEKINEFENSGIKYLY